MIISRTPFRISFFGGGTDYPSWYRAHGGAVLATTIDKYCYLTVRRLPPFFEHRFRVVYSQMENTRTVAEIAHPGVRETLRHLGIDYGLEIHHDADLPARSGLGSSSSFTVGLLHALHGLEGRMPSKRQLAAEAIHVEQDLIGDTVGAQDQVLAAHGGFNHVRFLPDDAITVTPLTLSVARRAELDDHLMLFYTGIKRTASTIAQTYARDMESKERQLRALGALVDQGIDALSGAGSIALFGELLHEAWQVKRALSDSVSNQSIEEIYEAARTAGAIGGKVLGAGGGGFMVFFVPPSEQARVRQSLRRLIHVPFRFESSGSQIVFFDPEEEYAAAEEDRWGRDVDGFREANLAPPSTPTGGNA